MCLLKNPYMQSSYTDVHFTRFKVLIIVQNVIYKINYFVLIFHFTDLPIENEPYEDYLQRFIFYGKYSI